MWWTVCGQIVQLSLMAAIILSSQASSRRAQSRAQTDRVRDEARRLRSALAVSLPALRTVYEDDLCILSGGKPPLISGRSLINLLRTQLGRLTTLDPAEIQAVMAASIAAERAETEMAIAGKKIGDVAISLSDDRAAREVLSLRLRAACSMLGAAEEILTPPGIVADRATDCDEFVANADEFVANAGAPELIGAVQRHPPHPERARLGELSF
jgi:hypothetical protein